MPEATGPRWQVVVLSWNRCEDTLACLEALERLADPDLRVICVDNNSHDRSAELVRARFPDVTLLENDRNLGFCGGNNVGIRDALAHGAEWVVLLNNDAVLAADALDAFRAAASAHPRAGVLGGKVLLADPPDRVWFAGQRVNLRVGYSGRPRGYGRRDGSRYARVQPIDRAVGALMAVSRRMIDAVGLLDEDLFAYVEDLDWCLRARRAGFQVLLVPDARAWHRVSAGTGGERGSTHTIYYGLRNTLVVFERHCPLSPGATWLRRGIVAGTFALHALGHHDRRAALDAVREGYGDFRSGHRGPRTCPTSGDPSSTGASRARDERAPVSGSMSDRR